MSDKTEKIQKEWKKYLNSESYIYNPDDKIITRHGCICKKKFTPFVGWAKGVTIKNACVKAKESGKFWCDVSSVPGDKCGLKYDTENVDEGEMTDTQKKDLVTHSWDYCDHDERERISDFNKIEVSNAFNYQSIGGLLTFIIIFVIIIPIVLYYFDFFEFLHVYVPNFDLLATAISYNGGPGDRNERLFESLYNSQTESTIGHISTTFINFISLVGLVFLVTKKAQEQTVNYFNKNKHPSKIKNMRYLLMKTGAGEAGLGTGMIMILFTYLLPNPIITELQHRLHHFLDSKFGLTRDSLIEYFIVVGFGLLIAACFILTEMYLIRKKVMSPIIEKIYSFLSLL
jgi:hypothetical protein